MIIKNVVKEEMVDAMSRCDSRIDTHNIRRWRSKIEIEYLT
ncbi:hypothetical protein LCGC14_2620090 [marine sediment metagenome]|uniref:Uncharacterized protein n=1 Tax=marine sediment metagenome TaxID=412755 RepID=A0A0F9AQX4_9ZZZZ